MQTTLQIPSESNFGKMALTLSLGGALLAVLIGLVARCFTPDARPWAGLLFTVFQIAALVVGWRSRGEPLGRAGVISAAILLLLSIALLA